MLNVKKILLPTDLSACADRAYTHAAALAARFGAEFHVLHVRPEGQMSEGSVPADLRPFTAADVGEQLRLPEEAPAAPQPRQVVLEAASVSEAIVGYAREHGIDLIVMGARGRSGLRLPRLGSVAQHVVRHAPCAVLTTRQPFHKGGLRRLLAPVDFSDPSRASLAVAMEVADVWGAQLHVLHVLDGLHGTSAYGLLPTSPLAPEAADRWEATLRDFAGRAYEHPVPLRPHVHIGPPAPTIINVALQL
jgi:nucleotide-binding universal stress UspA family protein